jgi:hypothetical protein
MEGSEGPVLPESFDCEPVSVRFRKRVVTLMAIYESEKKHVFELIAAADERNARELRAYVDGLEVCFEASEVDQEIREDQADLDQHVLERFLRQLEKAHPEDTCVALDVRLREAPDLQGSAVLVRGKVDPGIANNRCHGYASNRANVSVALNSGKISLHGVRGGPFKLGQNRNNEYAAGGCWVRGEDPNGSGYTISTAWILKWKS